jgi:hypothetical protein
LWCFRSSSQGKAARDNRNNLNNKAKSSSIIIDSNAKSQSGGDSLLQTSNSKCNVRAELDFGEGAKDKALTTSQKASELPGSLDHLGAERRRQAAADGGDDDDVFTGKASGVRQASGNGSDDDVNTGKASGVSNASMEVDVANSSNDNREEENAPLFGYPSDPSVHNDAARMNFRYSRAPRFLASLSSSSTSVSTVVSSLSSSSVPSTTNMSLSASLVAPPTFAPRLGAIAEEEEASKTSSMGFDAPCTANPARFLGACSGPASPSLSPAPSPPSVFTPTRLLWQVGFCCQTCTLSLHLYATLTLAISFYSLLIYNLRDEIFFPNTIPSQLSSPILRDINDKLCIYCTLFSLLNEK